MRYIIIATSPVLSGYYGTTVTAIRKKIHGVSIVENKGAIDLEMTLLPKEQAELIPVGFGRGPPSPLPDPQGRESNSMCMEYICGKRSNSRRNRVIGVLAVVAVVMFMCFCMDFPIIEQCQDMLEDIGILERDSDEALHPID